MKINKITKLTNFKWLNLYEVDYLNKVGNSNKWIFASRNKNAGTIQSNAVVIVPLLKIGRKKHLVVIKEFRVPLNCYEYGLPSGLIDEGEDIITATKRELFEETNLVVDKVLLTSNPVISSAGLSDEATNYVFVECSGESSTINNEETEDITIEVLDIDGVSKLRRSDNVIGRLYPILLMFEAMGKICFPKRLA